MTFRPELLVLICIIFYSQYQVGLLSYEVIKISAANSLLLEKINFIMMKQELQSNQFQGRALEVGISTYSGVAFIAVCVVVIVYIVYAKDNDSVLESLQKTVETMGKTDLEMVSFINKSFENTNNILYANKELLNALLLKSQEICFDEEKVAPAWEKLQESLLQTVVETPYSAELLAQFSQFPV